MSRKKTNKEKKTALVLSGGGSRGAYQIGVIKALDELGWSFDMVVGVSVGSLNGAMVVQGKEFIMESLWRDMETGNIFDVSNDARTGDFAMEFIKQGGAGTRGLKSYVDEHLDDELLRKSPLDFGVLAVEFPSMRPHYLWKDDIPKGKIGDYVMASCSAYPAVQPYDIDGKKYVDGGFEDNMPIHMAVERGATDIVAVYLRAVGVFNKEKELNSAKDVNLTFIQPKWELGNFLLFDKNNTARIMRLGYFDTMKTFGAFDGDYFAFIKGDIPKAQLNGADSAAKIFELDPMILYSKETFEEKLALQVNATQNEFNNLLKTGKKMMNSMTQLAPNPQMASDLKTIVDTLRNIYIADSKQKLTPDAIRNTNKKVAALVIANDLKQRGHDSMFLNRYALRIARDEILAARYMDANGLI